MAKVAHLEAGNGSTVHRGRNLPKRLPALTGPWLTAFTLLWLALLPLAVLAPVIGAAEQLARNQNPVWLPLGLAVQPEGDAIKIVTVLSREARTSGLKPGQEIIRIDGRPVPARNAITTVRPWLVRPEGAPMTLDVRDHRGSERRVQLTRREAHVREAFNRAGVSQRIGNGLPFVSNLLASLIFIPAAVLLFRRRRDSVPALLSLCLLIISASSFASSSFWLWRDLAEVGRWLNAAGWSALVLVLLTFPNGRFEPRWTLVVGFSTLVYLVGEGAALLPVAVTSLLLASLVSTAMLALLWRYRRLADTDERQQLRWVFLGFATGTVCLIIWTILVLAERKWGLQDPVWYFWLPLIRNPIGALGAAAVAIGLLVALLRYRLYDAETDQPVRGLSRDDCSRGRDLRRDRQVARTAVRNRRRARCRLGASHFRGGLGGGTRDPRAQQDRGLGRPEVSQGAAEPSPRFARMRRRLAGNLLHARAS
jgi:hypothetical protein